VSEFRWLLLAAGILILAVVFWWSRREASGRPPMSISRRHLPILGGRDAAEAPGIGNADSPSTVAGLGRELEKKQIVTVRLTGHGSSTFSGEALVLALREAGLVHGRFGIFHRQDPQLQSRELFSVASLIEPGSFDLTRIKTERYPGISLFLTLPGEGDTVAAFDEMLATAHALATKLGGELLDEHGSRLSIQRERYLREEVIRLQHKVGPS